jgi:uncharacterized protein DUF3617
MRIVSVLFASTLTVTLLAQVPTLKPGQYDLVSQFAMPGRPGGMPAQKMGHCYTPQELRDLGNSLVNRDPKQKCKVQDSKVAGSTLTYTTECLDPDGSKQTLSGQVNFTSQESFHAVVNMKSSAKGTPFADGVTITIDGKRTGDCAQ